MRSQYPSNNLFAPANENEDTLPAMPAEPSETLASFIRRVRADKDLTFQQIADASGGRISPNYVHELEKGAPTKNLGGDKIVGLGRGLGESSLLIFQLAMGLKSKVKDDPLQQLVEDYSALPKDDQSELRLMIELLRKEIFERRKRARK